MSVRMDDMRAKLHTVEDIRKVLSISEPLSQIDFAVDANVRFDVQPGWNHAIETLSPNDLVDASVEVGSSRPYQLTKEALLDAGTYCGLQKAYVSRSPSHLTQDALNYWFQDGLVGKEYKLLLTNGIGAAFTKGSIVPFSNLRLLDQVMAAIDSMYPGTEVLVDYKFTHSLPRTNLRLILPEIQREITDSGTDDDLWSVGITINNSLTGATQTQIKGYLFRWVGTNGAIQTHDVSANLSTSWSRKVGGQGDEVYDWAEQVTSSVLGGMDEALDDVQSLTQIPLDGEVSVVAKDLYDMYKIPDKQRNWITEKMANENVLTMYTLMQAITSTANDPDLKPDHVDRLLRVGGDMPHVVNDRCGSCRRLNP